MIYHLESTAEASTEAVNSKSCVVNGYFSNDADSCDPRLERFRDALWIEQNTLILHCGQDNEPNNLKQIMSKLVEMLNNQKVQSAIIKLPQYTNLTPNKQLELMVIAFDGFAYSPADLKTQDTPSKPSFKRISFVLPKAEASALDTAFATAKGIRLTRNLANLPSNQGTPSYIAEKAFDLAQLHPKQLKVKVLERADLQAMGMGAFLAIAQGSDEPPKLIEISYEGPQQPDTKLAPIVLVGKGITFDSGGLSLKFAKGMHEMKYDMAGAASVFGTIQACAEMQLPIHVIGLLACCENMPHANPIKPGDVVTSMSGKTIEITNTDAEGRMVMCDTLTYAKQFNPSYVVDIATLTGAVIVSLGRYASGLMSYDDDLAQRLLDAGKLSLDYAWRLPLDKSYSTQLESPIADLINASLDGEAGSITAGCFLSQFAESFRWAHLDIAGTAWKTGKHHNATGRPVALLVEFLKQLVAQ